MLADIRYAIRTLLRGGGFTAVAVVALALGIGASTAIFTVVNSVLLRPLPFRDAAKFYRIGSTSKNSPQVLQNLCDPAISALQTEARSFAGVAAYNGGVRSLTGNGEPTELRATEVTANFWTVTGAGAELGRTFVPEEGTAGHNRVAILSHALWRTRFHEDRAVLGKRITLDGQVYAVIGVMPATFTFPQNGDLWIPAVLDPANDHLAFRTAIGRLRGGVAPASAQAELDTIVRRVEASNPLVLRHSLLRISPLQETFVGTIRPAFRLLTGCVALLLLIACVNVANLLLARATRREQEMAVRSSLGATRLRLVRQMLVESGVLSLAGGVAGTLAATWMVAALLSMAPARSIPRMEEIRMDLPVFAFALVLSIATALAFGIWPALQTSKANLNDVLKHGSARVTGRSQAVRSALAICEIALASVLLTGAGLMIKSFVKLRSVDPGFNPENTVTMTVHLPEWYRTAQQMKSFHEATLHRLAALPDVASAGAVNWLPLGDMLVRGDFHAEGVPAALTKFLVAKPAVTPEYFASMGIRVLRGRGFSESDNEKAPGVMILGQAAAKRLWPDQDPIGKRISFADEPKASDWFTVIGVVDDVKQRSLKEAAPPAIYQSVAQLKGPSFLQSMSYVVRTNRPAASVAGAMRAAVHEVDRNQPVSQLATMDDLIVRSTAEPRFYSRVLGAFSLIALVLAVVGVYGVMAYTVVQRTREIGIRIAMGATPREVLGSVLARSGALICAGLLFGGAGALAATRLLTSFLFDVTPQDPATFLIALAVLAAAALAASYIPARRAANIDPIVALRYE